MRHRLLSAQAPALVLGVLLFCSAAPAYGQPFFEGLGLPAGAAESRALGVSPDGIEAVGFSGTLAGVRDAVRWTSPGGATVGIQGELRGASSDGLVLFGNRRLGSGPFEAFFVVGGTATMMAVPVVMVGGSPVQATARAYGISWDGRTGVGTGLAGSLSFPFIVADGVFSALPFSGNGYGVSADGRTAVGSRQLEGGGGEAFAWLDGNLTSLGDLPGGTVGSSGFSVSQDGSVIVGAGTSSSGTEAFRWTGGVMTGLGDLPGGAFSSFALSVSGDGSTVVGAGASTLGSEAFIWTAAGGLRNLEAALASDYGMVLPGWTLTSANAISGDGSVIVGHGFSPAGRIEAWRVVLSPKAPTVMAPTPGTRWEPGPTQIVTWDGGNAQTLDILFRASDTAAIEVAATGIQRKDGYFDVAVPNEAFLCTRCRVGIRATGGTLISWSEPFSIKGYQMTRFKDNGEYEAFKPNPNGWPIGNTEEVLFPASLWSSFDYGGVDPISGLSFLPEITKPPSSGRPDFFPDWRSWVSAFGTNRVYKELQSNRVIYNWGVTNWWITLRDALGAWGGSCFGMTTAALTIFMDPPAASTRYGYFPRLFEAAVDLDVLTETRVGINSVHQYQYSDLPKQAMISGATKTPNQTLDEIRAYLYTDDASDDRTLTIYNVGGSGGHSVLPYLVTSEPGQPGVFRVWIYDPNLPGDNAQYITFNTPNNTWRYTGFSPAWGGASGIVAMDPITNYGSYANIPRDMIAGKRGSAGTHMEVLAGGVAGVEIASSAGSVGYRDGISFSTVPGAVVFQNLTGSPGPPASYLVPNGRYDILIETGPGGAAVSASLLGGPAWTHLQGGSAGGDSSPHFRLVSDGPLVEVSHDGASPDRVALRTTWPDAGRLATIETLLGPSETLSVTSDPVSHALTISGLTTDATVDFELADLTVNGGSRLRTESVPVPAGADVILRPDWTGLGTVTVETDLGGDGTVDETVELSANLAPSGAVITSPSSGSNFLLAGDPAQPLLIEWIPGVDPDPAPLTYRWEVSASSDFSTMLVAMDAGTANSLSVPYGQLVGLLFAPGTAVGAVADVHHRIVTTDGQVSIASAAVAIRFERGTLTGVEADGLPTEVTLIGNYPNPFNPETTIRFGLPTAGPVRLDVFDLMGRRVRTLLDAARAAGWHEVRFDAAGLPSGAYVYRLKAGGRQITRQMTVLR